MLTAHRSLGSGAGRLTLLATTCLGVVALVAIGGRIAVQKVIDRRANDSWVINVAGRQRMLSQRLAKAALAAAVTADPIARRAHLAELGETTELFGRVHVGLQRGDPALGLPASTSPEVAQRLRALDPQVEHLVAASRALAAALQAERVASEEQTDVRLRTVLEVAPILLGAMDGVVQEILAEEPTFLESMELIVANYEREARGHVLALQHQESVLLSALLAIIVVLATVVLLPASRKLRRQIAHHEIEDRVNLDRALLAATMRERELIGKDLHDGLGQILAGIGMMLRTLAKRLTAMGVPEQHAVRRIEELVSDATRQTRELARALHPAEVCESGLVGALRTLAQTARATLGVRCYFEWEGDSLDLEDQAATHLYRIAQEAISNAVKHGQATLVTVHLSTADGALGLKVVDDGVGFPRVPTNPSGLGLAIMEGRARLLGGRLRVRRIAERGSVVEATFSREATQQWRVAA
ncbi:type IV pili methyl-accepting chemotaxis transducer N-terminal domain-containing protein [Candidatus Binatia bacterium]|jgi:signal transduction histidine kinase|nr:type IV pili methyl-accepting chemotaxis transducer N-terminal domain-containing protein [Candidatus Binatia bacterium]